MSTIIQNGAGTVTGVAVIAAAAALSEVVSLGAPLHGVLLPSGWTTANLTFQVSIDGGQTFFEMYDNAGNEITIDAAPSRYCALDPTLWRAVSGLIIRSGTSSVPVNQVTAVSIGLVCRPIL